MDFKSLRLLPTYETGIQDLVEDFYIPVLSNAHIYNRIAGFFSSTSLAIAARGIAGLINNNGKMRLVCSPRLTKQDLPVISGFTSNDLSSVLGERLIEDISTEHLEDQFMKDHVAALGWMLSHNLLEIKLAIVCKDGSLYLGQEGPMMHQKVGILYDEDANAISFSGSANESASGWLENTEEIKVFRGWEQGENKYCLEDIKKFDRFWNNNRNNVKVYDLPCAVRERLIEQSKDFDIDSISLDRYFVRKRKYVSGYDTGIMKEELSLFSYQEDAVNLWEQSNHTLILEMATGTGKTRTSIGCIKKTLEKNKTRPTLIVIACPQSTLSAQWKRDIENLNITLSDSIVCDSSSGGSSKWTGELKAKLARLPMNTTDPRSLVVYTTHMTASTDEFIEIINKTRKSILTFLIGDEVHGMGASKTRRGLLPRYEYRLGLSATPDRWFDEAGTSIIKSYFGEKSYVFGINEALTTYNPVTGKTFLVPFEYHPHFISLLDNEIEEYQKLTIRLIRLMDKKSGTDYSDLYETLLFQRAKIEKNAFAKYEELVKILDQIGPNITDTIIFVSDEQLPKVLQILSNRGIKAHQFTQKESPAPSSKYDGLSERAYIIKQFTNKKYQVLVAIKCLDEGIDIPSSMRAIVMASSTNPREYIQRIGRVIRQAPGKRKAEIHDLIIHPNVKRFGDVDFTKMETKIFKKEMERVLYLSREATNNATITASVYEVLREVES